MISDVEIRGFVFQAANAAAGIEVALRRVQDYTVGENAFPDQAPGLTLPITPDWVEITAAEAAGGK